MLTTLLSQLHKLSSDKDSSDDDNNYYYLEKIKNMQQPLFLNFSAEWFLASICSCVIKLNYSSGSSFAILNSETIVRALIKHRGNKQRSQKLNSWIDEGKCNTEKMIMLLAVLVLDETLIRFIFWQTESHVVVNKCHNIKQSTEASVF